MKTYKTCGVVMLPTNKMVHDTYCVDDLEYHTDHKLSFNGTQQHLYITSDKEPNEADLIIDLRPLQFGKIERVLKTRRAENAITTDKGKVLYKDQFAKIIATSNPSLGKYIEGTNSLRGEFIGVQLPQIPKTFILHYISEFNKGNKIEKVEVGYDLDMSLEEDAINFPNLKINLDNTINIKSLKESWSREEVKIKLHELVGEMYQFGTVYSPISVDQWINKNL